MRFFLLKIIIGTCLMIYLSTNCTNKSAPKPRGYFRIEFPEKEYVLFDSVMPYTFFYPKYARIEPDFSRNSEPYWINIVFPEFNAKIHVTYKNLMNEDLYLILEDVIRLSFNHTIKADAIEEQVYIDDENNVYGTLFEVRGNAASPLQFFATDSVKRFIYGSLYFFNTPNRDSLAPVIDFINKDVLVLMENIRWKY